MAAARRKIREWAIYSRLCLFIAQILFNFIIPDHESDGFHAPLTENNNVLDVIVSFVCGGLTNWDGQHFLHIAQHGYTYENNLAFFPLYPLAIKTVANTLGYPLQLVLTYRSALVISGLLINLLCFTASAEIVYELSRRVLKDEKLAYRAALLYCFNPASVFFSAVYSESAFATFVFAGMLFYERGRILMSSICFAFAGALRSNAIINCGFVIYHVLHEIVKRARSKRLKLNVFEYISVRDVLKLALCLCIVVSPFFAHQVYAYKVFCEGSEILVPLKVKEYSLRNNLIMPSSDAKPSWCFNYLPSSYSAIQDKYWDVGFLEYYRWKQIPNFLLAAPITWLIIAGSARYCSKNFHIVWRLGFEFESESESEPVGIDGRLVFVYLVHATTQLLFAWLFINVQVVTRLMCASSPLVCWFCAAATSDVEFRHYHSRSKLIILYFGLYFIVGTMMFVNELPFT